MDGNPSDRADGHSDKNRDGIDNLAADLQSMEEVNAGSSSSAVVCQPPTSTSTDKTPRKGPAGQDEVDQPPQREGSPSLPSSRAEASTRTDSGETVLTSTANSAEPDPTLQTPAPPSRLIIPSAPNARRLSDTIPDSTPAAHRTPSGVGSAAQRQRDEAGAGGGSGASAGGGPSSANADVLTPIVFTRFRQPVIGKKSGADAEEHLAAEEGGNGNSGRPNVDLSEFNPLASSPAQGAEVGTDADTDPMRSTARIRVDEHVDDDKPSAEHVEGDNNGTRDQSASSTAQPIHRSTSQSQRTEQSQIEPRTPTPTQTQTQTQDQTPAPTEPAFNFSGFLKDLRTKPAEPIARYLKSFLSNFAKKPFTVNEQIKLIHDFLRFISGKMVLYEPWKSQTSAELDNAMEAMEKLVMNRLYNYTFTPQLVPTQPITTDDLERDAVFSQRVRLFGWVQEKHLDVPEGETSQGFLGFAEQELLKINHYKAPRDKMICILNCCKVIFGLIRHTAGHASAEANAAATSADAFVPILIFVVLRANPDNLLSNVEYINRFRSAEKLRGESGYYLSSLSGAIAFIESMDASSLSAITQEEFEENVEQAVKELPPSPTSLTRGGSLVAGAPPSGFGGSGGGAGSSGAGGAGGSSMSPFATSPGEEPARPLTFPSLDNTRRFISKTTSSAAEVVSRPITAIGKILEGMQTEDGSASGSEDENGDARRRHGQGQGQGQAADQSTPSRSHRRVHRPRDRERPETPDYYHDSSSYRGTAQGQAQGQSDSPSLAGRFAGLLVGGDDSAPTSRSGTPLPYRDSTPYGHSPNQLPPPPPHFGGLPNPNSNSYRPGTGTPTGGPTNPNPAEELQHTLDASFETHAQVQAQAQMRQANVQTLKQMFPALDEEILEAVLQGCGDDLGLAIDRLLEM